MNVTGCEENTTGGRYKFPLFDKYGRKTGNHILENANINSEIKVFVLIKLLA